MVTVIAGKPVPGSTTRSRWWWWIWVAAGSCTFLCGVLLGVVANGQAGGGGGWFSQLLSPAFGGRERVMILAVGVDTSSGKGLADTIMVAAVCPRTAEISALSIPRDSRAEIPGLGVRRINAAHSHGEMPLTIQTVELLLGVPMDYYIEISVPKLVELVDAIGGVDLEVEKRMYYPDRSQGLLIDLQPGFQHLDGVQAMGYVRFRHDAAGDLGRMARQQKFLRAVMGEVLGPRNISRVPALARVFVETVNTNLSARDLLSLKRIVEQSGPEAVRGTVLPGEPRMVRGQSMIELDPIEVREAVHRVLFGHGLAVEVLNGTSLNGLAAQVAARLEEAGCDITEVGNAEEETDTTLIVDRRGKTNRAERVASWLGRGAISVAPDGENPADVTVILGRDLVDRY